MPMCCVNNSSTPVASYHTDRLFHLWYIYLLLRLLFDFTFNKIGNSSPPVTVLFNFATIFVDPNDTELSRCD